MYPTKILSEDKASINKSDNHSEKAAPLPEIFNYRINLFTHCIWILKIDPVLKKLTNKNSHQI